MFARFYGFDPQTVTLRRYMELLDRMVDVAEMERGEERADGRRLKRIMDYRAKYGD